MVFKSARFGIGFKIMANIRKGHKALVTVAIGEEYQKIARLTHPLMRAYAARIGAEFIVLRQSCSSGPTAHFEKYQLFQYLELFHRILYIDSDIVINPQCPDLFEIVPEQSLGVFLEEDQTEPTRRVLQTQATCGLLPAWGGVFFNSGVMVLSSQHRVIFDPGLEQHSIGREYEQAQLNWNAQRAGVSIVNIGKSYNHIVWELDATRYESNMIHYVHCCPPRWLSRRAKIAIDIAILRMPRPLRDAAILLKLSVDRIIVAALRVTLPIRRLCGLYNTG